MCTYGCVAWDQEAERQGTLLVRGIPMLNAESTGEHCRASCYMEYVFGWGFL